MKLFVSTWKDIIYSSEENLRIWCWNSSIYNFHFLNWSDFREHLLNSIKYFCHMFTLYKFKLEATQHELYLVNQQTFSFQTNNSITCGDFLVCSSSNISSSTWPKFKIKVSFKILRTSRFQNWPYFLDLVKIWWRYCQKTNCQVFLWTPCTYA